MELSSSTKKLIAQYSLAKNPAELEVGVSMIQVDEVVSKIAGFYEHIRTVVEWKEEHLMRRAAIIRKLKRRFFEIEKDTFEDIQPVAEALILELIRGGHFPNNKIPESQIAEVAWIIRKYALLLKDNPENQRGEAGLQFYNWLLEVCSCEIEDILSPAIKEKALIEHMFRAMKEQIQVSEKIYEESILKEGDEEVQIYIATCQALFSLDNPIISYNLIKYKYPNWQKADDILVSQVAKNIFLIWREIEVDIKNPLANKFYSICERYDTPYLLLGDILSEGDPEKVGQEIEDPSVLESKIKDIYKKRFKALQGKINRAALYLTISIFLTKILALLALQFVISFISSHRIEPIFLFMDVLIPTALMLCMVIFTRRPSKKNLNRVLMETMKIVYQKDSFDIYEIKLNKRKNLVMRVLLSLLYVVSSGTTLWVIYYVLHTFGFPITSIAIDVVFIALILFAGSAIKKRSSELTMEPEKEGFLSFISDIFFLPLKSFGKWISKTWRQYNAVSALFNALIDMPFTAFIEFVEGWRHFIKERKEDIR